MKKLYSFLSLLFLLFVTAISAQQHEQPLPAKEMHTPAPFPFEDIKEEQNRANEDHFISDFMNMLASLGLIIALIFGVSWFLKRFLNTRIQQINTSSAIKIVERRALTPKSVIYLLEVNEKTLIVAESTNGVTLLSQTSLREQSFSNVLKDKETS